MSDDGVRFEEVHFDVVVHDPESDAHIPGGRLAISGHMGLGSVSELRLDIEELNTLALEPIGLGDWPEGSVDFEGRLEATLEEPELSARITAELVDFGDLAPRFEGTSGGGKLDIDWSTIIGDEMQIRAEIPWDLSERRMFHEQGVLRATSEGLSLLMLLDQLPDLEDLDGTIAVDLEVRGFDETAKM